MSALLGGTVTRPKAAAVVLSCILIGGAGLALAGCAPSPEPTSTSIEQPEPPPEASGEPLAVVTIAAVDVDAQNVTVAGFVTELAETGGACTFDLTSAVSGTSVSVSTVGEDNSTSTSCGSAQVPVAELSKGPWDVVLHYVSAAATLESSAERVEVP